MNKITNSALELVGGTPLLSATRYANKANLKNVEIFTKLEYLNPTGSTKDRAKQILDLLEIDYQETPQLNENQN